MIKTVFSAAVVAVMATTAMAEGNADDGKKVFNRCKSCHMVGDKAKNRVGPVLNGIVGSEAGQAEGFRYSNGMKAAAEDGFVWTEENLAAFLTKPRDVIDGTSMSFAGLRKEEDIANVIAYLKTFDG